MHQRTEVDEVPTDDASPPTRAERLDRLAEELCRTYTLGIGVDEMQQTDPDEAASHRSAAEMLLPWIDEAPTRERKDAFSRGFLRGRERGRASQKARDEAAVRKLHERREGDDGSLYCDLCSNHGDITWPCATVRVLSSAE